MPIRRSESDHSMRRRSSRKSQISQRRLFFILIVVLGVGYLFWRYPDTAARFMKPLLSEPAVDTNPPAPILAQPTAPGAAPAAQSEPAVGTAWYQLFFTTPRYPDKPEYHHGGIDAQLVEFLNTATTTIDMAVYDFDLENVAQALAQAAGRGVRVRMVTDTDTLTNPNAQVQRAFAIVKRAKIPIVDDQRPAIMHNKFVVVDNQAIWTGSWNFTDGDTYHLNNNAIRMNVPELAQNYARVFETTGSETQFSEYGKFKKLKMDVLQDGNPYLMHHKVFIIDGATVIFGSFNFSNNADQDNDENLLIVDDPQLAQAFEAEFQRVREQALNPPKRK